MLAAPVAAETEWRNKNVSRYELIENYYSMVFTGIGNKNQPFDLSNVDFVIDNYNLEDETAEDKIARLGARPTSYSS